MTRTCRYCRREFRLRWPGDARPFCDHSCYWAYRRGPGRANYVGRNWPPAKADPAPPSPEEIRAACLEIQAEWDDAERERRMRCDLRPVEWSLPVIADFEKSVNAGVD